MKTPVIIINFKAYTESMGNQGVELAKVCDTVSRDSGVSIVVAPQLADLAPICKNVSIPVFSQHVDPIDPGSRTGHITLESVKAVGAKGTLINHSEHRLRVADIEYLISKCKKLGMISCVCTNNLPVSIACANLDPYFVAIEPPELIGGNVSVTAADPEIVENTVKQIQNVNPKVKVLCGAGVKNGQDVTKALELGTSGVLLASGVVKAKNPKGVLLDLVSSMR